MGPRMLARFTVAVVLLLLVVDAVSGRRAAASLQHREMLRAIQSVPGVRIKDVERQRRRSSARTAAYQQPLEPVGKQGSMGHSNRRSASAILGAMHRRAAANRAHTGSTLTPAIPPRGYENITADLGSQYTIEVTIDDVPLRLLVDTASADTWAVGKGFTCVDWAGERVDRSSCFFGPALPGADSGSPAFRHGAIEDQHMWLRYGSGELASGPVGYSDVEVGGITVIKQQISLVDRTYWHGNNVTSGVVGLGYPSLGHVFRGADNGSDWFNRVPYTPLFTNMVAQGLVKEPFFGVALARNSSSGLIGWGGMPEVSDLDTSKQAYSAILVTELNDDPSTADVPSFYTVVPDGFKYGSVSDHARYPFIIDIGTAQVYLPPRLAAAVNDAFSPPAEFMWQLDGYYTSCTATAPAFAVVIDGVAFVINPVDMIFRNHPEPVSKLCRTGFASGGSGPYILGTVFLNNVIVGFDVGAAEVKFISRPFY